MFHRSPKWFVVALVLAVFLSGAARGQENVRPDQGVRERAQRLLRAQATESLPEKIAWAERIKLGDPHKYIQPIIAAKLHFDPKDNEALHAYRWIMSVDRAKITSPGDRGLYHFSAIYKARLFFGFENVLPTDIRGWFHENEGGHLSLFRAGGTENHGMMSRTSGYLFAERFQKGGTGDPERDDRAYFLNFLREECKKLYTIGMGEWDSSTYVTFTVTGWANVYDFAKDPKIRELAKAALDWYSVAYGMTYFHGFHAGPEARGFANAPVDANSDVLAWLWFGGAPPGFEPDLSPANGAVRYAIGPALSSYRPDPVVGRIARKEVALPFAVRASKPQYYGYTEGNVYQEYGYYTDQFAMGTLYDPTPGNQTTGVIWPQTTLFKLAVRAPERKTTLVFGAANGYHRHFPVEGRSPYDQYHQERGAMINVCHVPDPRADERTAPRSLLAVPAVLPDPLREGGWYFFAAGGAYVAARPLGTNTRWVDLADWSGRTQEKEKDGTVKTREYPEYKWLQTDGALCGWVLDTATRAQYATLDDFARAVRTKTQLDLSRFTSGRLVTYKSLYGDTLALRHTGGPGVPGGKPEAWTNGKRLVFADWPVYDSPYVRQPLKAGVLTVNDGRRRMTIDFTGDWPVWRYENVR